MEKETEKSKILTTQGELETEFFINILADDIYTQQEAEYLSRDEIKSWLELEFEHDFNVLISSIKGEFDEYLNKYQLEVLK